MENEQQTCQTTDESLSAYHDAELTAEERSKIDQHLASCPNCTDKLRSLSRVIAGVQELPRMTVSAEFSSKLDASLNKQLEHRRFATRIWLPIAAAAAAVVVFAGLNLQHPARQPFIAQLSGSSTANQLQREPENATKIAQLPATPVITAQTATSKASSHHVASDKDNTSPASELATNAPAESPGADNVADTMQPPTASNDEELAELPSVSSAFSEAVGLATDEDGLYDLKM